MLSQLISGHDSLQEPTSELPFKKFRIVLIKPSKYDDKKLSAGAGAVLPSLWWGWWESKPTSFHGPSTWLGSSALPGSM